MNKLLTIFTLLIFLGVNVFAQGVTTGSITGKVIGADKVPLKSASVTAIHLPSGTKYGAITRGDGRFTILGVRVGGPYEVTTSYTGYEKKTISNVTVTLGTAVDLDFVLEQSGVRTQEITVYGKADGVFSQDRTGAATTVSNVEIQILPTISRRIGDFTRLTPQAKSGTYGLSFAGQDNRLNNITIDGSYINNSFGLAGQPGDRTGVAPVSIDALEQIQVNVAPYDVRQGNFVGAGVNMVTKSGTNEYIATAYYQLRNENFVGTDAAGSKFDPGKFKYYMFGATIGGPIIKNKLFFFTNFETEATTQPGTTYLANEGNQPVGGNITRVQKSDLDQLSAFLKNKYNYDTGPYQGYDFETPALRFVLKFDYNLDEKNKISLRYNHLDSKTDVLLSNSSSLGFGRRRSSTQALNFKNSNYAIMENIRSVIAEWNSVIANNMSNNLIVGYRFHDESREQPGKLFPFVDILKDGTTYTSFGTEPFTPSNKLDYSTIQLQNNFTYFLDNHTLLFGVSIEKYHSTNVFFPGSQSVYVFNSLQDFYNSANGIDTITIRRFQYRWSNIPGQDEPIQPLDVIYAGAYLQDEWNLLNNFKLTGGIRVDIPFFGDNGYRNPEMDTLFFKDETGAKVQYKTEKLPDPKPLISPRLGFNWDVFADKSTQVRGGTGVFTAQPAYVWISNQIGNNGMLTGFEQLDNTKLRPFKPDPNAYKPKEISGKPAASYELALTDPNFKFPQIWRTNIGIDQRLPFDLVGSFEFIYSKDLNGIYYINANLKDPDKNFVGVDTRPRWTSGNRINSKISNAIVLKNQDVGYSWNIAATLEKPWSNNWFAKVGYAYGEAKNTVDPGSIAFGSWNNNQHSGNPNNPGLGFSAYTPDHRIFGAISYKLDYFNFGSTTFSLFFDSYSNGRSSYVMGGDMNGDGGTSNDLIYIPKDKNEMYFQEYKITYTDNNNQKQEYLVTKDMQANAWEAFIQQDDYLKNNRGKYAERNGVILPMVTRFDFGLTQEFYSEFLGFRNGFEIRLDILNLGNLINKDWGVGKTLTTTQPLIVPSSAQGGPAASDGTPQYRLRTIGGGVYDKASGKFIEPKFIDKSFTNTVFLEDVYRFQLTLRYKFN
mgnify:CR=1 FL=1